LTLLENHGIKVRGRVDDTMLMHHALQPELSKDLGTLGSLYINVPEWKSMRVGSKAAEKKDA
jgi:DNA polymerase I-like protein with 3'-5' exonuclease and polymerase domains